MFRVVKMTGVFYACEIRDVESAAEDIEEFTGQGGAVVLCEDLDALEAFGVDVSEIVVI